MPRVAALRRGPPRVRTLNLKVGQLPADRTWLRWGSKPYFLALDGLTLGVLAATTSRRRPGLVMASAAVGTSVFAYHGLYRPRLSRSILDDLPPLVAGLAATLLTPAAFTRRSLPGELDRGSALALAGVVAGRALAYTAIGRLRCSGRVRYNAIVVGAGHIGIDLARLLREHREYGVDPVGFVDLEPRVDDSRDLPVPLLGSPPDLAELIEDYNVRDVIVSFSSLRESQLIEVLRTCDRLDVEIFFVPRLFELQHTSRDMDYAWGIPLVRARRAAFRSAAWRVKRLVDVSAAGAGLVVLSPIMAACAVAVRLEGGPGVIFKQERVGMDGKPFTVYKFRSLRPVDETESRTNWNVSQDDRLGPVGRLLRKTSLDELPQLWNILKGDMTLVGPRPERPHFVKLFGQHIPRYVARHRVPAGLTGWAQVHGLRGDTSIQERARFDNYYIENWSLWGDLKIIARTIGQILRGAGA